MAINWGNIVGNVQDSSGNKPGGGGNNTSGGGGNNTSGGGGNNKPGFFSSLFGGNSTATPTHTSSGSSQPNSPQSQTYNEASNAINNLIADKPNLQNQPGVVTVNPKFNDFIANNTNPDGSYNSAAQAIINQYDTGTNAYQQAMNNIIQSSPQGAAAYANQFPISNALMNAGPAIAGGGLFPGGGLIMSAFNKAKDAGASFLNNTGVGAVVNQGMDFIQDNFMTSGSITEKPEEVDQFKNYLNNLQGLNTEAMNAGVSPFITQPGPNLGDRDGVVGLDPRQIATVPVEEQGLDAFFGGQSKTDSFEDFDSRIKPRKTTQDYIDEFNEQFNLDEKKEIFGIEGKEIITPGGVEVSDTITSGITPWNQKSFSEKLEKAPEVYQKLYERMSGEMNMTDAQIEENLRRIGSQPSNMFPYFPFKSGGITRL